MVSRVAFQGERGAFSEEAILRKFGRGVRPIPFPTLTEVFESVENGRSNAGVVPIENSVEGSVNETYDLLLTAAVTIRDEVKLRIRHNLISRPSARLADIRVVYSHPQALAQCRNTLMKLGVQLHQFYDTAGSVKFVAESADYSIAAVASLEAARIYKSKVLLTDIQDSKANFTRFLVLGKIGNRKPSATGLKTSLVFSTEHKPGTLYGALGGFAKEGINLTKIESRPTKDIPWEYNFYVDFEGRPEERKVKKALSSLESTAKFVKILGTYPLGKEV